MRIIWLIIVLGLAWTPMLPATASAAVVGRITQVEGRVDLLKGGHLPATPVKVGDRVDAGDVLRSKSRSRAQVTFIDNSIINISPTSRLAIEDYRFDPDQGKRWAVLQIFQGLAHVVVNKIFKVEEPDFIVKTNTAVTGVRGTDFGVRLLPNRSTILNFQGKTRVGNIFPEVHTWERRARKTAYQQPRPQGFFVPGAYVDLEAMQGTTVQADLPPTLPYTITALDRKLFMNQVAAGLGARGKSSGSDQVAGPVGGGGISNSGTGGISNSGTGGAEYIADLGDSATGGITPTATTTTTTTVPALDTSGLSGSGDTTLTLLNTVTVPPAVVPVSSPSTGGSTPSPSAATYTFTQYYYGAWITLSESPYTQSSLTSYYWGYRTGVYEGYFYALTEGTRTGVGDTTFASMSTGTVTATSTGTVTGILGGTLTGTMELTTTVPSGATATRTGTVTLLATGELIYDWTDTVFDSGGNLKATGSGTSKQTPGTYFSQTVSGQETATANLAGNQATGTNYGDLTGTRVENGISTAIRAGYSVTETAPNAGDLSSSEPNAVTVSFEGVLGAPDANGVRVGVMTGTSTTATDTTVGGGPVREVPATATTPAATFATVIGDPKVAGGTSLGIWAQTSDPSATIVTQTYEGSGTMTSSAPYTTGSYNSTGWGIGSGPGAEGPETVPLTGSMAVTVNQTSGSGTFDPVSTDTIHLNTASVRLAGSSGNYQGPSQAVGIAGSIEKTVITTAGTTTANISTGVVTNNFSGTYFSPDGKGTLTGGTQTMTPGTYFEQTTNSGTGAVTISTPVLTTPATQTSTLSATMTRTGVAEGTQVLITPSSVITSTTNNPSALPAAGTVPANINIQGVVGPSGTGNMTLTVDQGPGTAVSTYKGPVTIDSSTKVLTATNLVGRNPANPGVNRVPAKQTGTVTSQPSP